MVSKEQEQQQWAKWRNEIAAIGGTNPLINFESNTFAQIDLERSHPGGYSQFITGGQTLLSNLVRDPLAFSRALSAARRIKSKSEALESQFGIETLNLIGGVANFEADGFDLNVPILIWPVSMIRKGDDYELALDGPARVNPALIESLVRCYGITLEPGELLARQNESSDLVPVTVLNFLANLIGNNASLDLRRVLVIANCSTVVTELLSEFTDQTSSLIDSLLGEDGQGLAEIDIPELNLVADADATQMRIVARALAGQNFAVETLPGCGYLQTVVNVVAGLAHEGKRVLVVAPREQTLAEQAERFSAIGLSGLGVRADSTWVDVVSAISRNEKAEPDSADIVRAARIDAEVQLDKYFEALNSVDPILGVSVARILRELSKLSAISKPALTRARIRESNLLAHVDRATALNLLNQAHDLGEFKFGPQDSAWYQAVFESPAEVALGLATAKRLQSSSFPNLSNSFTDLASKINFKPAETAAEWGIYLQLLVRVRETLDRFLPDVFERPLTELIAATAPRKGDKKTSMSGSNRRRLKKLAREYLRAGMHVSDMHSTLISIQEQRDLWRDLSLTPGAPQVPLGINDVLISYQGFIADLTSVQAHLDPETSELQLADLSIPDLKLKLESLSQDTEALANLGERATVMSRLRDAGLGSLARDLGRLHATKEQISMELDQAWWQSALESVMHRNSAVLGYTPAQLEANEITFRKAYEAQIAMGAKTVAHENSKRWKAALVDNPAQANSLKEVLKTRTATFRTLAGAAPRIWPVIAPVAMLSPYLVPSNLSTSENFDCVLVLDAAGTTLAENIPSIHRAKQLIAFGDDAVSAPLGFLIEPQMVSLSGDGLTETDEIGRPGVDAPVSIFETVRRAFGVETLRKSYRGTSTALGNFINREFYQNRIELVSTAAEYRGENSFNLELVTSDNTAKTTIEGATESLDGELAHAVELIFNHAKWHPEQSLLVASASLAHAQRIRSAVKSNLQNHAELATFFESHGREKFEVTSIAELTHRNADRVIFSVGFGKTSHGAVLSNFGQLSHEHGKRYLANLLISARQRITVVSCFEAEDLPSDKLSFGATLLKDLLLATRLQNEPVAKDSDPMLVDLSLRLKKLGARVDETYSSELPLVVSFAKSTAVIQPDWSIPGQNQTEKFRIRPGLLAAMGWHYFRVYSFELFSDPQAVAIRIAELLGMQVTKRPLPLFDSNDQAFEDSDLAWGDKTITGDASSNDQRLRQDKPPHWG